jgi:hypothetical protein
MVRWDLINAVKLDHDKGEIQAVSAIIMKFCMNEVLTFNRHPI